MSGAMLRSTVVSDTMGWWKLGDLLSTGDGPAKCVMGKSQLSQVSRGSLSCSCHSDRSNLENPWIPGRTPALPGIQGFSKLLLSL